MIEYNKEKSLEAKNALSKFPELTKIYKEYFSYAYYIGPCNELCEKLKPKSYEDFAEKYFKYAEEHKDRPIKERGLTKEEFHKEVLRYKQLSDIAEPNNKFEYDVFFHNLMCHIITETFDGHNKWENELFVYLKDKKKLNVRRPTTKEDINCGIDIIVCDDNDVVKYCIQVKPSSFFIAFSKANKEDSITDNKSLVRKYFKTKNLYNVETYYCVYNENEDYPSRHGWVVNKDNKITFRLSDIYDENSYRDGCYDNLMLQTEGEYKTTHTKIPKFLKMAKYKKNL